MDVKENQLIEKMREEMLKELLVLVETVLLEQGHNVKS